MPRPIKKRLKLWADFLAKTKLPQTKGALRRFKRSTFDDSVGDCCLGIACRVYEKHSGRKLRKRKEAGMYVFNGASVVSLPDEVANWFGVDHNPYLVSRHGVGKSASLLNDEFDYTFKDISEAIYRTFDLSKVKS